VVGGLKVKCVRLDVVGVKEERRKKEEKKKSLMDGWVS
jgi:hypothetical protein